MSKDKPVLPLVPSESHASSCLHSALKRTLSRLIANGKTSSLAGQAVPHMPFFPLALAEEPLQTRGNRHLPWWALHMQEGRGTDTAVRELIVRLKTP